MKNFGGIGSAPIYWGRIGSVGNKCRRYRNLPLQKGGWEGLIDKGRGVTGG